MTFAERITIDGYNCAECASAMQKCFKSKFGKDPGDLTGPIIVLSTHSPVMTVAKLIDDLDPLVKH